MAIIRNKPPEHSNAGKALKVFKALRDFKGDNSPSAEEALSGYYLLADLAVVARSLTGGEDEWFSRN